MRIAATLLMSLTAALAQSPDRAPNGYIERVFRLQTGDVPQMGWFDSTNFVAQVEAPELSLYGVLGAPLKASNPGPVDSDGLARRRSRRRACDFREPAGLVAYATDREPSHNRALYTRKPFRDARSGLVSVSLDPT